jgi:hypothetical protein
VLCGATGLAGFFIPAIVGIEDNNNGHAVAQEKTPPAVAVPAAAEAAE